VTGIGRRRLRAAVGGLLVQAVACGDAAPGVLSGADPEVREVLVVGRAGRFAFDPEEVAIPPGGRVRFVHTGFVAESVRFPLEGLEPQAAEWVRERGLDAGPLLTRPGEVYDVTFDGAPEGLYPFRSAAHEALGMRGAVRVESPG
jgi:plastocyanin